MRIGQAKSTEELLSALDLERRHRMEIRRGLETVWWNNILLVSGDHYAQWNAHKQIISGVAPSDYTTRDPHRVRLVLNHAMTVARTELAKLIKQRPIMEAIPASDDAGDIASAKVAKRALDALEWKFKLRALRKKAAWWTVVTGTSGVAVLWDPSDARDGHFEYVVGPDGRPVWDPAERQSLLEMYETGQTEDNPTKKEPMGDVHFALYSPFQLLPDPTALWWEDINDLITIDVMNIDVAADRYGRKVLEMGPDEVTLGTMERRALYRSGLSRIRDTQVKDAVYIYTHWLPPGVYGSTFLKDGAMTRWIKNGHLLDFAKPYPFMREDGSGSVPLAVFEHIPNVTSIWADSIMQHIRGPNLEMDKTASQLIENKDYLCNPMWRRAAQHRVRGQVKNVPGGELVYHHVPNIPPPEPIPGIALPAQVENMLVYLRDQILDISGQGETSRGRVPSGVRAGVMIQYLQEEDETRLGPTVENLEDFVAKLGSLTLERVQQFYSLERLVTYPNADGQMEAFRFKGSDLRNNTDVICVPGSAFPRMKAAKQQFVLELVGMGIETDPKRVRDLLELGGAEPDEIDLARQQARRENTQLIQGQGNLFQEPDPMQQMQMNPMMAQGNGQPQMEPMIPVQIWHNDEIHLKEHYAFMSSPEFEQMTADDPSMGQRFVQHTGMHELNKLMKMQQQMMMALAGKGAPTGATEDMPSGTGADGQRPGKEDDVRTSS